MNHPGNPDPALAGHLDRLRKAARTGTRTIVGIVGMPGTGKSTLAQLVADELGPELSVVVPMDGFHLAKSVIEGTPLAARRGAIDTFDAGGYLSLLKRIVRRTEPVVYAPFFLRGFEDPIGSSIAIPANVPIVVTEGNYLLADQEPWSGVRAMLSESWFVDTPSDLRIQRLIERHIAAGKTPREAQDWAEGPDEANARFIGATRSHADIVIDWS